MTPLAQPLTVEIKAYETTPTTGFVELEFAVAGLSLAQGIQVLDPAWGTIKQFYR